MDPREPAELRSLKAKIAQLEDDLDETDDALDRMAERLRRCESRGHAPPSAPPPPGAPGAEEGPPPPPGETLLTARQVADRLAVSTRTVWRMVRAGRLCAPVRYSRKLVRWKSADLGRWIQGQRGG